jgi:hypothetical protein
MAISLPEQVGGEVECAGEREARELVQPQAPAPGEVELGDAGIRLPGLLLLAGGAVDEEGGRGGAEERGGATRRLSRVCGGEQRGPPIWRSLCRPTKRRSRDRLVWAGPSNSFGVCPVRFNWYVV